MCVKLELHITHTLLPSSHVVFKPTSKEILCGCSGGFPRLESIDCGAEWLAALMVTGAVYAKKRRIKGKQKRWNECVRCLPLQPPNVCFILESYLFDISKILPNDSKYS